MKKIQGTVHVEPDRWSQITKKYGALLPKSPMELVKVAITPHPPLVPKTGDRLALAHLVCRGYYSACMNAYGRCVRVDGPTIEDMKESGHLLTFSKAIDKLRDYKLPPAAWSAFSIDVWQEYVVGGKGGQKWDTIPGARRRGPSARSQPTPQWVFSDKRMEDRTKWFSYAQSEFAGGKVIFTPALKKLSKLYKEMKESLMIIHPGDLMAHRVIGIIAGTLPPYTLRTLIERSDDEAADVMRALRKRLKAGEWIW